MLLSTNDGVVCDYCRISLRLEFTYFSLDIREKKVFTNSIPYFDYKSQPTYSIDMCQTCIEGIKDKILKHYKPFKLSQNRTCPQLYCELSGAKMSGTYIFYHMVVSEVSVKISAGTQKPLMNVQDKIFELFISKTSYDELHDIVERNIKLNKVNKENTEWLK